MSKTLRGDLFLLTAAFLWGLTFIAQKQAMTGMGAFTYSGIRFLLGGLCLLPVLLTQRDIHQKIATVLRPSLLVYPLGLSFFLFWGIGLQQWGILYTSPTNSALLTSVYILLVPMLLSFAGRRISLHVWGASVAAFIGSALLMINDISDFNRFNPGDLLSIVCAFFWAGHIIFMEKVTAQRISPILIAVIQSFVAGGISLMLAVIYEAPAWGLLKDFAPEFLLGGVLSIAVGFTLQIYGQRDSPPTHAAVILSLEALFAALADFLYYGTVLTYSAYFGALLMLGAGIYVQLTPLLFKSRRRVNIR